MDLTITIIQSHLFWEETQKNLNFFESKIKSISQPTDIIVLPEMFTTGFTMNPKEVAEEHGGEGLQWMLKMAKEKKCAIVGSISVKDNNKYYNRLYWAMPDNTYQFYDKRHLFRMGKEDQYYESGTNKLIVEFKGWKICPLVCYDLRFPVWSRNKKDDLVDLLIYVANWPEARAYPWKQLLIARAIENQVYVVGVNRIGEDGNGINYSGDSCIINPRGEVMSAITSHQETTETMIVSKKYLQEFRTLFPAILDADDFNIN